MNYTPRQILFSFLAILGIALSVNLLLPSNDEHLCNQLSSMYHTEYHGIVTNKFVDSNNHNNRTLHILSGQDIDYKLILSFDKSLTQVGDTIYKLSNSINFYLNEQPIKLDYGVECEDMK